MIGIDHTRLAAGSIPTTALRRPYKKLIENPKWRSQDKKCRKYQCVFTEAGETAVSDMIYENYLTAHLLFTKDDDIVILPSNAAVIPRAPAAGYRSGVLVQSTHHI
jgi:hypothetical protein